MLTISFFMFIILMKGFVMSLEKMTIKILTRLINLSDENLIEEILNSRTLISDLAKTQLIKRNPLEIDVSSDKLVQVVSKMTIEEIWSLVSNNPNTDLAKIAYQKLLSILDYYDQLNEQEKVKEKLHLIK